MKLEQNLMLKYINEWPFMVEIKLLCSFLLYMYSCPNLSYSLKGKSQMKHVLEAIYLDVANGQQFFSNSEQKTKWVSNIFRKLFEMHPNPIFKNRKKNLSVTCTSTLFNIIYCIKHSSASVRLLLKTVGIKIVEFMLKK